MTKLAKLINKGNLQKVYDEINSKCNHYSLETISKQIGDIDSKELFIYLTYAISRSETIDKYITICDCLEYMKQFLDDNYSLIRWYVYKAIDIFNDSIDMKKWVIDTYFDSPTPPFNKDELLLLAKEILKKDNYHLTSLKFIENL